MVLKLLGSAAVAIALAAPAHANVVVDYGQLGAPVPVPQTTQRTYGDVRGVPSPFGAAAVDNFQSDDPVVISSRGAAPKSSLSASGDIREAIQLKPLPQWGLRAPDAPISTGQRQAIQLRPPGSAADRVINQLASASPLRDPNASGPLYLRPPAPKPPAGMQFVQAPVPVMMPPITQVAMDNTLPIMPSPLPVLQQPQTATAQTDAPAPVPVMTNTAALRPEDVVAIDFGAPEGATLPPAAPAPSDKQAAAPQPAALAPSENKELAEAPSEELPKFMPPSEDETPAIANAPKEEKESESVAIAAADDEPQFISPLTEGLPLEDEADTPAPKVAAAPAQTLRAPDEKSEEKLAKQDPLAPTPPPAEKKSVLAVSSDGVEPEVITPLFNDTSKQVAEAEEKKPAPQEEKIAEEKSSDEPQFVSTLAENAEADEADEITMAGPEAAPGATKLIAGDDVRAVAPPAPIAEEKLADAKPEMKTGVLRAPETKEIAQTEKPRDPEKAAQVAATHASAEHAADAVIAGLAEPEAPVPVTDEITFNDTQDDAAPPPAPVMAAAAEAQKEDNAKKIAQEKIDQEMRDMIVLQASKQAKDAEEARQKAEADRLAAEEARKAAEAQAQLQAEAAAKAHAEAQEARKQTEMLAQQQAAELLKARQEAEAKVTAQAEALARIQAEAIAKAQADAAIRAQEIARSEAERIAKAQAEEMARQQAEALAKIQADADAKAKLQAEALARAQADAIAKAEAEKIKAAEEKVAADKQRSDKEIEELARKQLEEAKLRIAQEEQGRAVPTKPIERTTIAKLPRIEENTREEASIASGAMNDAQDGYRFDSGVEKTVFFDGSSASLPSEARAVMKQLSEFFDNNPDTTITLQAYADASQRAGSGARRLSLQRAVAMRDALSKMGIPMDRIAVRAQAARPGDANPDRIDITIE